MFNVPIRRQQGGSELAVAQGGSLNIQSGGKFNIDAGGNTEIAAGGSLTIVTGVSGTGFGFDIGGSRASIGAGPNVPTHTAVPGSMYIRVNGSMSGWFVNIGQDASSSAWRAFQQGSAIG